MKFGKYWLIIVGEQSDFAFLTTKYDKIVNLEHLVCPKVGGQTNLCPPLLKGGGGGSCPSSPPPLSYASGTVLDMQIRESKYPGSRFLKEFVQPTMLVLFSYLLGECPLLVDQGVPEGTYSQVLRSTSVDS